ncbi:MAG: RagB/SusD family nutrient uptake outer membrane protein [Gemmatimonadetes bacterium]|nr:RagB/SusD family nutrient uptake outer membrane protein [Gemmatimonadota bacterium]NNM07251.1 RagB/SusD family nutrient uptake outer membrane protein [Gemmatimonadota bacterium]
MMMRIACMIRRGIWAPLVALFFLTAGCGDIFDVSNPGQTLDSDLNDPNMIPILLTGLSADVSDFMDNFPFDVARLSDELAGSGSYADTGYFRVGWAAQDEVNGAWEQAHEAIWMAELHVDRILNQMDLTGVDYEHHIARAWVLQGVAHRTLGENHCQVVYSDEGEYGNLQPRSVAFDSAAAAFNRALSYGGEWAMAAHAGLASAYAGLGQWDQAAAEAALVDDDLLVEAYYDQSDNENELYDETHDRHEMSAYNTYAGSFSPDWDPRAPITNCELGGCPNAVGADGVTVMWRQEKFNLPGSEIPILTGAEARLIQAEAALRNGNLGEFTTHINRLRAIWGLDPIVQPASAGALEYPNAYDDAWSILDGERMLTLWLEGRRLWDLHRWDHPFLNGGTVVWPGEPRRDSCMPVPAGECRVNPNFTCTEAAAGTIDGS